ncbi:MAG: DUF3800 domain-containing protein [Oscillospiraceae bacterium]|nr:DUF3800 domain-containing protein [Oscillospiraceae bacterium]
MKILSVFCDESGDFGVSSDRNAYYLVTMVYHDQNIDLSDAFQKYDEAIARTGFNIEYVHTGPIIRREEVFANYTIDERRKLLYKLLNLYTSCDIRHATICVPRKEAPDKITLSGKLARQMKVFLTSHDAYFGAFDKVIVYYDNGQSELSAILNAVFSMYFLDVEFRKAEQQNYRLLQIADFICSMELLSIKRSEKRLSQSEEHFFFKPQELKKTFLKSIEKKRL